MIVRLGWMAFFVLLIPEVGVTQTPRLQTPEFDHCTYWRSRVDPGISRKELTAPKDARSEQAILEGMSCLLNMQGNKANSTIQGATSTIVSQTFGTAPIEVAALYYVSYLYYEKWDHAQAACLVSEYGGCNDPEAVAKAYTAYREWLKELERVGIKNARDKNLDPLNKTNIRWY